MQADFFNKKMKKEKVLMAMSGGVDSSVAALLLKEKGYNVTGIFMHFWSDPDLVKDFKASALENKCCSVESYEDAKRVAKVLGIGLYSFSFRNEFKKKVVDYFINTYKAGRTPNPCVECNHFIKFALFLKKAKLDLRSLSRIRIGPLTLGRLPIGLYRQMKQEEIDFFQIKLKP